MPVTERELMEKLLAEKIEKIRENKDA